jgi:hypothetical protein
MCNCETVKLWTDDTESAAIVAAHYGEPLIEARMQIAHSEQQAIDAGF